MPVDSPKKLSPEEVDAAVNQLRAQLQRLSEQPLERIDCSPESLEQGRAKLFSSGFIALSDFFVFF